jgi:ribonuclease HII
VFNIYEKYKELIKEHKPKYIVGLDETGNGAIAGCLCVAGCALPVVVSGPKNQEYKIKDSKLYTTDTARNRAYKAVMEKTSGYEVRTTSANRITEIGHWEALERLYEDVLQSMYDRFGDEAIYILDGNKRAEYSKVTHTPLVKADKYITAVSAASIIAKYERDMITTQHPLAKEFGIDRNKGYGTKEHMLLLNKLGPIKGFHRMNIEKVQKAFDNVGWYSTQYD